MVLVDPGSQRKPALQPPEQAAEISPGALPNLPTGQSPLQAGVVSPAAAPKLPRAQRPEQAEEESPEELPNEPTAHSVAETLPERQKEPMGHATVLFAPAQLKPGGHGAVELLPQILPGGQRTGGLAPPAHVWASKHGTPAGLEPPASP